MTADEYRACLQALGLTAAKPSYEGATLYVDRDGLHTSVPDPEPFSDDERLALIEMVKSRLGIVSQ